MTTPITQPDLMEVVEIPRELFDFLMGTGQLCGTGFDEMNAGLPGRFWWRALLSTCARTPVPESGEP